MKFQFLFIVCIVLFNPFFLAAQDRPIGFWRSHMPHNNALSIATDGVNVYTISDYSFFKYNAAHDEITTYSKVEGMSDVGMSYIAYDATTGYTILTYKNANIDLFKDETFFNLPDIKLKNIGISKNINHIHTENGLAYLSTNFGIVVLNLLKKEIKETYSFTLANQNIEVKEVTTDNTYLFAVTSNGLYRADKRSPSLPVFSTWEQINPSKVLRSITTSGNKVFVNDTTSLFVISGDTLQFVYKAPQEINALDSTANGIWINESFPQQFSGKVRLMNLNFEIIDSFGTNGKPSTTLSLSDHSVWVSDVYYGLCKKSDDNSIKFYKPQGPQAASSFDILPYNGDVWVAHGGYNDNWTYIYNGNGISHFKNDSWTIYNSNTRSEFQDATDLIVFAKDPIDGTLYAGAYRSGLFIFHPNGSIEHLKEGSILEPTVGDPSAYRVSGLAFDNDGNLWVTQAGAVHELIMKPRNGDWIKYSGAASTNYAAYVLVDDYNQKWYLTPNAGGGVAVYNDNYTPENPNDDKYARINTSEVSSIAISMVKDKSGAIWIGTSDGIGVINCPGDILTGNCKMERPIVQFDQFAGYLFQGERVKTIAVDGANRKWVGTTNGVWLVSPEGDKIIYRFTADNSPLPSNNIQKIAVDPITGDVYIGTADGLVSYRSTATDGGSSNQNVISFPNPVPSSYAGTIAIHGLSENADVRITDISGQLVFRTKALGGQAIWNGLDYTGRRPQSGVYLIFVTNRDGSETHAGKMVFME